jgi:two-component system response regulator
MKRILLVEDDTFLRTLYTDILKSTYLVDSAANGEEAYKKFVSGAFDLALLDMILPDMSGVEIIEKLKIEHPDVLKKNIVFLTNMDKKELTDKIAKLGYSYLMKSDLSPDEFLEKVKQLLI